ncbi:MAG TPA: hypothetical protein VFQ65_07350, partial [Kofleriaceae bacterium]|nr:hypothetical protein [Kofleriaceae bacterium]
MKLMLSLCAATLLACGGSKPQQPTQPAPPPTGDTTAVVAPTTQPPVSPEDQPLALAPDLKKGMLPNGLTYYIRRHG